ncbi:MAG: cellulase family glycosylhydrolase [Cyclobacteriaceae bacterium]|nr:cellulase family glycosylhydrolase [Cyclobacteriaceae bacterium]
MEIQGRHFLVNGSPFEFCAISFFNALYNPSFNTSTATRMSYLNVYKDHGINVLRIWCQWDNTRNFADAGANATLYHADGSIKTEVLNTLVDILKNADKNGAIILLVLFSRESWNENIRLSDESSDKAVAALTGLLRPHRNLIFQIWNEFDYRTVEYTKIIKSIDPERIVTNSPGYSGILGSLQENNVLDYLSPHTTRDDHRHWEVSASEIQYLVEKFNKPVVDDEPARRGTPMYGGPKSPTLATDHIIHIYNIWKAGGYVIYHHDMFQTGYGSDAVPKNGIPLPGFSNYHDQVFDFLKNKDRYIKNLR